VVSKARRAVRLVCEAMESRTLLSTMITWASDVSGDWDDSAMWTGDAVPGPADDAVIPFSDITVTHSTATADSVNSLTSQAALDLTDGSLSLATTSSISRSLTLQGATLSTAGTLTVNGSMTWVGGTVSGGGVLDIASGASLNLGNGNNATETLDGAELQNAGTASLSTANDNSSGLALENGAGIDNQSGGGFTLLKQATVSSDGSATYFTNEGSLTQGAGVVGVSLIEPVFTQTSSGSTAVNGAFLAFTAGGTVSGSVGGAAGTTIEFDGASWSFDGSSSISSDGSIGFATFGQVATLSGTYDVSDETYDVGSTLSFMSPITALGSELYVDSAVVNLTGQSFSISNVQIYNASVLNGDGGASLTVSGTMTWAGGTITGFGALDIAGGASLNLGNGNNLTETLDGVELQNAGVVSLSTAGDSSNGLALEDDGGIDNQVGGSFTFLTQATISSDGSATYFTNEGSLIQAYIVGVSLVEPAFTETSGGSTTVDEAFLAFTSGGIVSGSVSGLAGTTIEFDGPTWSFDGSSSITSAGAVDFSSGGEVVGLSGTYDVTGETYANGSTVSFTAPITALGSELYLDGAVVNLTGQSFSVGDVQIYNDSVLNGDGAASLTVTAAMTWAGGTITGFGALGIASSASLNLGNGNDLTETLDAVELQNAGAMSLSTANNNSYGLALENSAGIDNQAGGSFTFLTQATISNDGSATYFTNEGSLIQSVSVVGVSLIEAAFTQTSSGSTTVNGAFLAFTSGGTVSGSVTGLAGTTIELDGPTWSFDTSSSITSAGSVGFATFGQVATVSGTYDVTGETYDVGSTLSFMSPITALGLELYVDSAVVNLTGQSFSISNVQIYNDSVLNGDGGASLTATAAMTWAGGTITGFGALEIPGGASLNLGNGNNLTETLDAVELQNAGTVSLSTANNNSYGLALENSAGIDNQAGGSFTIVNNATISSDESATYFTNDGSLVVPAGAGSVIETVFDQGSTGSTTVQGALVLVGGGSPVTNAGQVMIDSGATLTVQSDYDQTGGSTTLSGGSFFGGNVNIEGGSLIGTGAISADVTNAGQVVPGGTEFAGVLTINGTYTQTAAGALDAEIGGTTAGTQYDQLDVSGQATLTGTLVITLLGGFSPSLGQSFTITSASPLSGTFPFVNESGVSGSVAFQPTYSGTNVVLVAEQTSATTVTSSLNPSTYGQSVTFTATVKAAPPNTGKPTGSVAFYDGSTPLGRATLSSGKATLKTSALPAGSQTITVVYLGDTTFATSTSETLSQSVAQDATTTKVTSSANRSVYGQSVSFTATVKTTSPGSGTPTGTVQFLIDGSDFGGPVPLVDGSASSAGISSLSVASHSITAVYSGDPNFTTSTSTALSQTVNQDGTTTALVSSVNPSVYGQMVTFTATVSAKSPGSGTPTGSITFSRGSTVFITVSLSNGCASFTTSSLAAGIDIVKASYSGDSDFKTSAGTVSQTVNPAATATALASSTNPSVFGQPVTFTATVSASAPGSGTPTGSVTFMNGSTRMATVALSSGSASYSTAKLPTGQDTITAMYNGSGSFLGSNTSLTQIVNQDSTTTAVASATNPSVYGRSVTFSVSVSANAPGAGTPTGGVTLTYASLTLTATLSGGKASLKTAALPAGSDLVTVSYGGDTNFLTSSATLSQTINTSASVVASSASSVPIDHVLSVLQDESSHEMLIGDLAFEQMSSKKPGSR
jgi:Bacterial Ig-like domain (group 3)